MVLDDPSTRSPEARDEAPWQHDKKNDELEHIGKPIRKVDARSKVSGLTQFADDNQHLPQGDRLRHQPRLA